MGTCAACDAHAACVISACGSQAACSHVGAWPMGELRSVGEIGRIAMHTLFTQGALVPYLYVPAGLSCIDALHECSS